MPGQRANCVVSMADSSAEHPAHHAPGFADAIRSPIARARALVSRRLKVAVSLAAGDLIGASVTVWILAALIESTSGLSSGTIGAATIAGMAPLLLLIHLSLGLYDGRTSPVERLRLRILGGMVFAAAVTATFVFAGMPINIFAFAPGLIIGSVITGHCLESVIRRLLVRAGVWGAPTIIFGSGAIARNLAKMLSEHPSLGFRPVGPPETALTAVPKPSAEPIEVAVVAYPGALPENISRARDLPFPHIVLVQDVQEMQSLWVRTRPLGASIGIEIRRNLLLRHNLVLKRTLDLSLALPLAIVTLPLVGLLALAVKLADPGPALYRQPRVGRQGKPIDVLKLRTMYSDADTRLLDLLQSDPSAAAEWERYLKLSRDPRILPVIGRFMRRASLDELPQLWNIVRGEMSLVGPRPFPSYHVSRFDAEFQGLRMSVVPGLTGLWQVSSRSDGDLETQKAEDTFYIMNWSIWFDLYIIIKTIPAVLLARGAR